MTAEIRTFSTPRRLFRYRSLVPNSRSKDETPNASDVLQREIKAVTEGYIFCPTYGEMNDPMEGVVRPSVVLQKSPRIYETRMAKVEAAMHSMGIASFAEMLKHEPMWAHYAGQFRGICIAYDFKRLLGSLVDGEFVRMNYSEQAPLVTFSERNADNLAKIALSVKSHRWMSEREWRLFSSKRGRLHYNSLNCVRAIYLGSRVNEDEQNAILDEIEKAEFDEVNIFRMKIDEYEIAFKGIENPARAKRARKKLKNS